MPVETSYHFNILRLTDSSLVANAIKASSLDATFSHINVIGTDFEIWFTDALSPEDEDVLSSIVTTQFNELMNARLARWKQINVFNKEFISRMVFPERQQTLAALLIEATRLVFLVEDPEFSGSGANDLTILGEWDALYNLPVFEIEVDGPETVSISKNGVLLASGVAITGGEQPLGEGLSFQFGSTSGHETTDLWVIKVRRFSRKNRAAYIFQLVTWVNSVLAYYYSKCDEIDTAETPEAVDGVTWDYTAFEATCPGVTILGALAIPD